MSDDLEGYKQNVQEMLGWFDAFCTAGKIRLRSYQLEAGRAIAQSVLHHEGNSFVVLFPRQSGKNELQAHLEAFFLFMFSNSSGEMVKVSPTWRPQCLNAIRRLERVLRRHPHTTFWEMEGNFIFKLGQARVSFFSGAKSSNIVGATASLLLEVDEAQNVQIAKFDKDVAPMAASTNATRVFWGTAWTSKTLLARELLSAQAAQAKDGRRRVFRLTAEDVRREVPAYGLFVDEQVAKLGRNHPMVKTQFFSEEIDAEGGMFPAWRLALMQGEHEGRPSPMAGPGLPNLTPSGAPGVSQGERDRKIYAALVDVAGEDEGINEIGGELNNPGRDSTALTIVEVDLTTVNDLVLKAPTYRVMQRRSWVGVKHSKLYGELRAMAELWRVRYLVIDATGVGAGLASFLDRALPGRVLPFVFSQASKSQLGWDWLGVIDSGRWKEAKEAISGQPSAISQKAESCQLKAFWRQLEYCEYEILPGPAKMMRWGVQDGRRDVETGDLVHDDLIMSSALCGVLEGQNWSVPGGAVVVRPKADPLAELDKGF